jgi:pimeloyl-ACP methyl ester carboxylesterase
MPDKVKAMNRAVGHKMFHEVRAIALNHQPLSEFRTEVPMTIVHGEHTRAPARAMSEHLAKVNPHAQLEVAAGLGHMSVITQADQVAASLQNHWARVLG